MRNSPKTRVFFISIFTHDYSKNNLITLAKLSAISSIIPMIVGVAPIIEDKYNGKTG